MAALWGPRGIVRHDTVTLGSARPRLSEQLTRIEAEMTAAAGASPLAGIAGHPDARKVWDGFDLARKKMVIDCLMTIEVLPATEPGKGFDGGRVRIDWRQPEGIQS
jgi:hypothetical protein